MKLTSIAVVTFLCVALVTAKKERELKRVHPEGTKKEIDPNKGKREAPIAFHHGGPPRSSHVLQLQPAGGSLSIGAGYSLGGAKLSSSYGPPPGPHSFGGSHFPVISGVSHHAPSHSTSHSPSFSFSGPPAGFSAHGGHSASSHSPRYTSISSTIKKLNAHPPGGSGSSHGPPGHFGGHFLSTEPHAHGGASPSFGGVPKPHATYGVPQFASFSKPAHAYGAPASSYGPPAASSGYASSSLPSYAAGIQGLGAYASSGGHGFSGALFSPAGDHGAPAVTYGVPSAAHGSHVSHGSHGSHGSHATHGSHSSHGSSSSDGGILSGFSFGGPDLVSSIKNSFSGLFGGYGQPTHGGSQGSSGLSSSYGTPSSAAFKPSVYLGSSVSESYGTPAVSHKAPLVSYGPPQTGHGSHSTGGQAYIIPKGISSHGQLDFESLNSLSHGSFADGSHGSPSLSGSYRIPSAGHSAPAISFGALTGHYDAPSASYGVPSFGHSSSSSSSADFSAPGHSAPATSYSASTGHAAPSAGYGAPSFSHAAPSGGFGLAHSLGTASFAAPSSGYGAPGGAGAAGLTYEGIGAGQLELPSATSAHAFSSAGSGPSAPGAAYGLPSRGFSGKGDFAEPEEAYGAPDSYEDNYAPSPSETKYDTIKYSRSLPIDVGSKN